MTQPHLFSTIFAAPAHDSSTAEGALTMLGPSAAMSHVWTKMRTLAPHVRAMLLTGAPDCGQQAVARLLLDLSLAPKRRFVQVDAADAEMRLNGRGGLSSLPADVFLYVPDIQNFSFPAAEDLLRTMRMRRSRPFTVVAATTEDLQALVAAGRLPADLARAFGSVTVEMPCLKERREDLPMLLGHLLAARASDAGAVIPSMKEDFLRAAMEYAWPGNLRELVRIVDRLVTGAETGRDLTAADFHRVMEIQESSPAAEAKVIRMVPLETVIQEHIKSVLYGCRGNKLRAAEVLGISRSTLYRMLDGSAAHTTDLCVAS